MPGALQTLSTPPAPDMAQQGALSSGGGMPQSAQPAPPQQQQPMPAPTHQQTVAGLRHFAAIGKQLEAALKDPDVGKADIKDKVIDGMTQLVADRIMSPAEAVSELAGFPARPFEQKAWLAGHLQKIVQARDLILDHYRASNPPTDAPPPPPSADNHMQDMAAMMQAHYSPQKAA